MKAEDNVLENSVIEHKAQRHILEKIVLEGCPLIDVRAPIEFAQGSIAGAVNLPILMDSERHEVGIRYKQESAAAAQALGHELVSGAIRDDRIWQWLQFIDANNTGKPVHLFCFRGGLRSRLACDWINNAGHEVIRIPGGYKALRHSLLAEFNALPAMIIVSGRTGVGKTELLDKLPAYVDLEGLANHRGSAFGKRIDGQPTQINFENALAAELIKLEHRPLSGPIYVEDEGRLIGRSCLPPELQLQMKQAPIVLLEDTLAERVDRIYREYIIDQWSEYLERFGDSAFPAFSGQFLTAVDAIKKRLGGVRHKQVHAAIDAALSEQSRGNLQAHKTWISMLLVDYYDPMYNYQLDKKTDRIVFSGTMSEICAWAKTEASALVIKENRQ